MDRVLEPELMDGEVEADAYARADFSHSNRWFVEHLVKEFPGHLANVVDLGCGPADVPVRLALAVAAVRVTAVDGSAAMLRLARQAIRAAGVHERIALHLGRLPDLELADHSFDAVLSKDMLHHLPDPQVLWREARRLARPGAVIYVVDLMRPDSPLEAREIVARVAGAADPVLKEDFYNSLCAAFTLEEVRAQLKAADLPLHVHAVSERHMNVKGRTP